jgi:menaquinone-specific isochorismate synthase
LESALSESLQFTQGFLYGEWNESRGVLGLTPEILVKEEKGNLQTMALAGTCDKETFKNDPNSFLNDPKEAKEHQKVVEEISRRLKALGDLKVGDRQIQDTPTLVHLKTPMQLENFEGKIEAVVSELHPTPALGSFPQKAGTNYLEKWNELLPRGVFGAPFGFSENREESTFLVAIRNLIWTPSDVKILCGCGVVEESDLEQEWLELENKKNSVKRIFGVL